VSISLSARRAAFRTVRSQLCRRKYGKAASKGVVSAARQEKRRKGGPVTSRKPAIAISLSEVSKNGARAPRKESCLSK